MIRVRFRPAALLLSIAVAACAQAQTQPAQTPPAPATQPAAKTAGTQPTKPPPKAAKLDQPEGKAATIPAAPRATEPKTAKSVEPPAAKAEPNAAEERPTAAPAAHASEQLDLMSMVFVFMLATFLGIGIIRRVSRLLHTPLMSLTNAISAIAVVGSIMLAGGRDYPTPYKWFGAVAIFASMTNIISGFLITDRMLKMFKSRQGGKP